MAELRMHPHLLNNQKEKKWKVRRLDKKNWRSSRPGMSEDHLSLIRQLPCCRCGSSPPSDPHHLKSGLSGERGMALKATDRWTVPLCRSCHDELERLGTRRERDWFESFGIVPHYLAEGLWKMSGNLERMRLVIQAHKENAHDD